MVTQYTEFTSYAALLSGAPPSVLQRSLVAQHRQTIKLLEWHLLEEEEPVTPRTVRPLVPGNPCRGHVPDSLHVHEAGDTLELSEFGGNEPLVYHSLSAIKQQGLKGKVRDIFLTGQASKRSRAITCTHADCFLANQGHSAWGQFSLIGRVRPCDGLISLSKEYVCHSCPCCSVIFI